MKFAVFLVNKSGTGTPPVLLCEPLVSASVDGASYLKGVRHSQTNDAWA